jgi:tetratricopeptide (TPR) repeat protein
VRHIAALLDRLGRQGQGEQEPSKPLASLHVSLALNLLILGRYPETAAAAGRGAEISRALGDTRMEIWAEMTRGPALGLMGQLEEARRLGEAAIPVAEAIDDDYGVLLAVHFLGGMCVAEGDFAAAVGHYGRAQAAAERLGAQSRISAETANLAEALFYLGEWERARHLLERALQMARAASSGRTGSFFQYAHVFRQLGAMHAAVGEWEVARMYLEEAVARAEQLPYPEALRSSQGLLAEHELLTGHPEAALARLEPLLAVSDVGELGIARLLPTLAEARAACGDTADAERVLAEGIARTRAQRHRLALVDLLRAHGVVLGMEEGRRDESHRSLDEAAALAHGLPYPHAEARALYEQGRLHAAMGQSDRARARLEEALAIFRRLGARPDVERAQRALAAVRAG